MSVDAQVPASVSQQALKGAGWIIAWRFATRNIGLVSTLILVRLLQPTDFGLVALATGFINSLDALSAIGIQDALARAPEVDRDMYDTGFGLSVLRGTITAFLVAVAAWPIAWFFDDQRLAFVMLALSTGTLISAFEHIGSVDFRRSLAFRKEFDLQLWSRLVGEVATNSVAAIWHSYWALVVGILVYRLARLLQSFWMCSYRPSITLRAWRSIIGFSLWSWGQTLLYQARERLDSIVIGRALGTAQVGVFSIGLELGSLPATELVEPLGRALFSGFATLHNASAGLDTMFLGAVGLGFMLVLPAGLGISMIADPMVRLCLGEHWLAAVPVVQIIAITGTTAIFTQACASLLNAVGKPETTFYVGIASTLAKLVALLALLPWFGLPGAATALAIAGGIDLVLLLRFTLPRIRTSPRDLLDGAIRPLLASAAMVAALRQAGLAWTASEGTNVAILVSDIAERAAFGATCYTSVLAILWLLSGRPDGGERLLIRTAINMGRRLFARA